MSAPEKAIRHPKRGKAHRVMPDWPQHYWSERTRCGLPTLNMTQLIPLDLPDPSDRCLACYRGVQA